MTPDHIHDALTLLPSDLIEAVDKKRQSPPKILPFKRFAAMAACFALVLCCSVYALTLCGGRSTETAAAPEAAMMQSSPSITADASPREEAAPMEEAMEEAAPEEKENGICNLPTVPRQEQDATATQGTNGANSFPTRGYPTPDHPNASYNTTAAPENLVLTSRQELENYLEEHSWRYDFADLTQDLSRYPEAWFRDHDLLITVIHASPAGTPWTVTAIQDVRGTDSKGWEWFVHVSHSGQYDPNREITNLHLLTQLEKNTIAPGSAILTVYDTTGAECP